jgi:hypothetical protein
MPTPQEICLEDLDLPEEQRVVRCVALPGGEPGLALDRGGVIRWMPAEPAPYALWISTDERLVLIRGDGAAPIVVRRADRSLEAPVGKPVLLRDQDLLQIEGRTLRVHVHGPTSEVRPPERLSGAALARVVRAAAAVLALSVAAPAAAAIAPPPIEVRQNPPGATPARPLTCSVVSTSPTKTGLQVKMSCPANHRIGVGFRGNLYDASRKLIKDGVVVVKEVRGSIVVGEAPRAAANAASAIFYVGWS